MATPHARSGKARPKGLALFILQYTLCYSVHITTCNFLYDKLCDSLPAFTAGVTCRSSGVRVTGNGSSRPRNVSCDNDNLSLV